MAPESPWQAISGWLARDGGAGEVTLMFTELGGFSSWVLEAGDQRALGLLREVATVVEPCIAAHRGRVVKRLGHGHMAVFPQAGDAVQAALDMQRSLGGPNGASSGDGHPRLRAGLHVGQPQRVDGDYLGADVNIAARITEAARPGEVLVSGEVLDDIGPEERKSLEIHRRRAFRAKGAPPGLEVYRVASRDEG